MKPSDTMATTREEVAKAINASTSQIQTFFRSSLEANAAHNRFHMLLNARIEGVKSLVDLTKSAIQKSGVGGG